MSQTDDSNFLKDYKAPDFKLKQLDIDFSGEGTGYQKQTSIIGNIRFNYQSIKNNKHIQSRHNLFNYNHFNYNEAEEQNLFTNTFSTRLRNNYTRRAYFNKSVFFGINDFSSFSLNSNYINNAGLVQTNVFTQLIINPGISIGVGRVEFINYARKSEDISRMLQKSKIFKTELNPKQKTQLANKVAMIQNRRFFDTRLNRMYQIESIDSVLQSMNLVSDYSMKYFTELSDAFLYSFNKQRLSGDRLEFIINNRLHLDDLKNMTYAAISYELYLPTSYKIQHDFEGALVGAYTAKNNLSTDQTDVYVNYVYRFGFYPNTRTYISANIRGSKNILQPDYSFNTGLQLSYYISPKFRINLYGIYTKSEGSSFQSYSNILYNDFNIDENITDRYTFKIGLNYALF
jgi:hypothetical protein